MGNGVSFPAFAVERGGKVSSLQVSMNDALEDGLPGTSIWKLRNINTEYDVLQSGVPLLSVQLFSFKFFNLCICRKGNWVQYWHRLITGDSLGSERTDARARSKQ
jgi:hypothetical protein